MPIRTRLSRVTVGESEIDAAFKMAYGDVYRNMVFMKNGHVTIAKKFAPERTGRLKASIDSVITPSGKYQFRYSVNVHAPYAEFTLRDTPTRIFPNKGAFLWVRPKPYSYYTSYTPRMFVSGYHSKDWLGASTVAMFKFIGVA